MLKFDTNLEEIKKYLNENDGCTHLVVKKRDGIFVTVYKTRNLRLVGDSLCINEENHPEVFIACDRLERTDYVSTMNGFMRVQPMRLSSIILNSIQI